MPSFHNKGPVAAFLSFFIFFSSALADYYIDDTNVTLTYSSGPKAAWAPYAVGGETLELLLPNGTYQVIDAFVCWNHTYRYAACFDTDDCLLTIPFMGSGITVFVYQAGPVGINASITIDGANPQTNVLFAPPAPAYEIANVSMFNVQRLSSGPHTLSLLINDLSGSYSGMMFDYAYVNESLVANSTIATTSSAPASTTTTTSTGTTTITSTPEVALSSGSHTNVGAIAGSVVGLVVVAVSCLLAFICLRRRRRHARVTTDYSSTTLHSPSVYEPVETYEPNQPAMSDLAPVRGEMVLVPNRLGSSNARRHPIPLDLAQGVLTPFTATPNSSTQDRKTYSTVSNDVASTSSPQSQGDEAPSGPRQDMLTDEQADFINTLYQNNVPAAAIARVMERMLVDRHAGIREWERETRLARSNTMTTAPPSYDLLSERG